MFLQNDQGAQLSVPDRFRHQVKSSSITKKSCHLWKACLKPFAAAEPYRRDQDIFNRINVINGTTKQESVELIVRQT